MSAPLVSFLLPTRQRPQLVHDSLHSLRDLAYDPACFEVLLGIDTDDPTHAETIAVAESLSVLFRAVPFFPLGYSRLHTYNNTLARNASGSWLAIWNDDARMLTRHWDSALRAEQRFALLDPEIPNGWDLYRRGLFPVVPRLWHTTLGHLSQSPHCDTYMCLIAECLHIKRDLAWSVFHDRFDETGHNDDATYRARTYSTNTFYDDPYVLAHMNWDARRLGRVCAHRPGTILRVNGRSGSQPRWFKPGERHVPHGVAVASVVTTLGGAPQPR